VSCTSATASRPERPRPPARTETRRERGHGCAGPVGDLAQRSRSNHSGSSGQRRGTSRTGACENPPGSDASAYPAPTGVPLPGYCGNRTPERRAGRPAIGR
jgi:hypothetical protein